MGSSTELSGPCEPGGATEGLPLGVRNTAKVAFPEYPAKPMLGTLARLRGLWGKDTCMWSPSLSDKGFVLQVPGSQPTPTFCMSLKPASPFCFMKANTVGLPSLITAVPSQQKGDRTDGPKLWDKASLNVRSPSPGKTELDIEGQE